MTSRRPIGEREATRHIHIPSQPYEIAKNGEKTGGFAHVLAYKSPTTPFFALKYFIRYTHETFFEEYTNFEGHYLSRCRDIPLQSFGSHIRPPAARIRVKRLRLNISLFCWQENIAESVKEGQTSVLRRMLSIPSSAKSLTVARDKEAIIGSKENLSLTRDKMWLLGGGGG